MWKTIMFLHWTLDWFFLHIYMMCLFDWKWTNNLFADTYSGPLSFCILNLYFSFRSRFCTAMNLFKLALQKSEIYSHCKGSSKTTNHLLLLECPEIYREGGNLALIEKVTDSLITDNEFILLVMIINSMSYL